MGRVGLEQVRSGSSRAAASLKVFRRQDCPGVATSPSTGPSPEPQLPQTRLGMTAGDSPSNRPVWTPARFALFLGLLVAAAFPDVLFGLSTFYYRDFGSFGYPLAFHHRESFWRGELPLWNPLNNCGIPFLAQWNTLVLYPPSLIYLLLPLPWSLNLFCLGHLFLGGISAYFLAWHWTRHQLAAACAGVLFAFSGFNLSALMWPAISASLAWAPLVLLWTERACRQGGRAILLAAG